MGGNLFGGQGWRKVSRLQGNGVDNDGNGQFQDKILDWFHNRESDILGLAVNGIQHQQDYVERKNRATSQKYRDPQSAYLQSVIFHPTAGNSKRKYQWDSGESAKIRQRHAGQNWY